MFCDSYLQASPSDGVFLWLNTKKTLRLDLIYPGEEIFVPMGIWPNSPVKLNFRGDRDFVRFRLKKGWYKSKEKCNDSQNYNYGGIKPISVHSNSVDFLYLALFQH